MRLAAIDVGSNSVHMVVAELGPDGRIAVVDRVKEMVRLGRHVFTTGRLSEDAMELALQAMKTFARLARARRVDRVRAVATSAVREATNGAAFVRRLRRDTGIPVKVISGPEEARLIYRAAHHALGLERGPHLLVDVGGGSVELVLVQDGRPIWLRSLPLGAARLTERFFAKDPPTRREVARLERHLAREMGDLLVAARHAGVTRAIGTSGTTNALVALARAARGDELGRLHGASASARELTRLRRRVLAVPASRRAEIVGMDAKRVDLMPAAVVLVDYVLARAGIRQLFACGWALREGLLLELAGHGATGGRVAAQRPAAVRRRSVEALGARFGGTASHGAHVARLALALFDGVGPALGLRPASRELLEYAALLHDIGHAIDHDRHQHHSCYLVRNAELLGFERAEIEVIAQAVRGHRKQMPKIGDPELRGLPGPLPRTIRALAAMLRVADALDRTHFGVVRSVDVDVSATRVVVAVETGGENPELELWAAGRRTDALARLLDRPVVVRWRGGARLLRARAS